MPLMPAPPMPTKCTGCGNSLALFSFIEPSSLHDLLDLVDDAAGGVRAPECGAGRSHRRQAPGIAEQLGDQPAQQVAAELGVVDQDGRAAVDHPACVLALVVGGRVRIRDQDRRLAQRRQFGHGAAGASHDEIRDGHGRGQAVSVGHQAVALKPLALRRELGAHGVVVARPADVHELEAQVTPAERVDAGAVDALRALAAAEGEDDGQSGAQGEGLAALGGAGRQLGRRERPPGQHVLGRPQTGDREAEADAPHKRPQEPVGDAQVGIGLQGEAGDPTKRGQRDDRAAGEAAAADGDVGPHLLEDAPDARHGGGQQPQRGQMIARREPAREALELQRERLVVGGDTLDLRRRGDDDDAGAPGRGLSRDGERRLQMTAGPPRREQRGLSAER